ncbi:hypothetical protein [Planktothrix agardhii]|nr:hypothetical protein [Planktothrix agardhii]MCF3577125.1 hypothetical protein [Planktothrix agardhii 1812]
MKITFDQSFISGKFLPPYLSILDRYLIQELVPPFVFGVISAISTNIDF